MNYQDKIVGMDKALSLVKSGYHIVTGMAASEARAFMLRLHEVVKNGVKDVTVSNCLPMADAEFIKNPEYSKYFNVDSWFYTPALRAGFKYGNIAYIPNHLHLAGSKRLEHIKPNIYVGNATPPDKHGYVSLSLSNTYEKRMIEAADIVILEINPKLPRTFGDVELHVSQIDYMVETDYDVPEIPDAEPSELDYKIGKMLADEINDGDCIQLGIGGMPNAIAKSLYGKKHLGVHTEMLTGEMAKLTEAGVIDNSRKRLFPGKSVCTFALGARAMYDFLDDNPGVFVMDGGYVNDPNVIALNDNQVSINSSIEVDLLGQCASESIGTKQISGTGGQSDTAVGAQNSKGGRSYIALYSTAMVRNSAGEKVEVSKITARLNHGAVVSLSRNDVDRVVTEYGIAELKGTNSRERVERLVAIAHPKFRESLMKEAYEIGLVARKSF